MNKNIRIEPHPTNRPPWEGEAFVKNHLDNQEIKNKYQYRIYGLKDDPDNKPYRVADFYLPRIKLFVEFNGRYNISKEDRIRYKTKTKLYRDNGIPCVQIYPENLGVLEFTFNYRALYELKHRGTKWNYYWYRVNQIFQKNRNLITGYLYLPVIVISIVFTIDLGISKDASELILIACATAIGLGLKSIWGRIKNDRFIMKSIKRFD